ncbi:MAG: alpha/beta hydrolase [Pseudomonadales bacterium]|nr:alpha/beta hydrolase [Pseudomonadales bacterium]
METNYQCDLLDMSEPWAYSVHDQLVLRGGHFNQGRKTLIHFMPGTAFGSKIYWPFLSKLAEHFDIFWHDYQGHGDSDCGNDEFHGWRAVVDRAKDVIQQHELKSRYDNIIGMGHSYGGCMTIILAGENPGLFDQLLLTDPFMVTEQQESSYRTMIPMLVEKTRKKVPTWESESSFRDYLLARFMFKNWEESAIQATVAYNMQRDETGELELRCKPVIEAGVYADVVPALWPNVSKLEMPVKIISGNQTVPFFAEAHRYAAEMNENISLSKVEGGHNFMQEYISDSYQAAKEAMEEFGY